MGGDGVVVRVRGVGPDLASKRGDRSSITPEWDNACQAGLIARFGPVRLLFESSPVDTGAQSSPAVSSSPEPSGSPVPPPPGCLPPASPFSSAGASPSPAAQSPVPASTTSADTFGSWYQVTDDDERAATGLWVGRLDGPAFHVVDEPTVRADGPVDGRVLVWRSAEGQQTVSLVDTADESAVEVLRTEDGGVPILAPDGQTMYWIELAPDGRGDVWRMRVPDGKREPILRDRATQFSLLHLSLDGRYLALEGGMDDPEHAVVVDTTSGETWDVRTTGGSVVGFLGRRLVTHSAPEGDEDRFPLVAVDPRDGATRTVARSGIYPAIVPDADGRGVLVWRTSDDAGTSIVVRDSVGSRRRTIHTLSRDERKGPSVAVVRRDFDQGIEVPGYVALFPDGHSFVWPEVAERYEGRPRSLVSIADGSVTELEALQPAYPASSPAVTSAERTRARSASSMGRSGGRVTADGMTPIIARASLVRAR